MSCTKKVRESLLPKKSCSGVYYIGEIIAESGIKAFEKNVYDLCHTKKLDDKQCGVLAYDIQA
jgi:hypothetical protein